MPVPERLDPPRLNIIGAGLAGCEAAWQAASLGVRVGLFEMKPDRMTPAHRQEYFAELVCSNSFRAASLENAVGLLKEEMQLLDSLVMRCAMAARVPAGGALAVDRDAFSMMITRMIREHPLIFTHSKEIFRMDELSEDVPLIIATGPLTADALSHDIADRLGSEQLHFFDAAAPVLYADSIDMSTAFRASRYGKGGDDYINCPMDREQYLAFYQELIKAEAVEFRGFEHASVFEGCMPVESMAVRGVDTLRFGPMKPVGLQDPKTGKEPHAVVQLRQDDHAATLYNIVGFQTHLLKREQQRVFRMIPGLQKAEFARYGAMHRNTYIQSPGRLDASYRLMEPYARGKTIYFAGQLTGVEGYVESTASGLAAGIHAALGMLGGSIEFMPHTAIGALARYISDSSIRDFQPMNINYGIIQPMHPSDPRARKAKKDRKMQTAENSLNTIRDIRDKLVHYKKYNSSE